MGNEHPGTLAIPNSTLGEAPMVSETPDLKVFSYTAKTLLYL